MAHVAGRVRLLCVVPWRMVHSNCCYCICERRTVVTEASVRPSAQLQSSFQLLNVEKTATIQEVREAYIEAVKKYHPDSKSSLACAEKFTEVKDAYRRCMSYVKNLAMSKEVYAALEEELRDIEKSLGLSGQKKLAHRRYLTHDGGRGRTVFERQKSVDQLRLSRAIDNVFQNKYQKALENPDDKEVGKYTGGDPWLKESSRSWIHHSIERIADDQIREAMARGDFTNIDGSGKPMKNDQTNIALDYTSQRLNKVLIDSGFAPEWVSLDKEIRHSIQCVRRRVALAWHASGPHPMNKLEVTVWESTLADARELLKEVNASVNRLNLIVPIANMQKAHFSVDVITASIVSRISPDRSLACNQGTNPQSVEHTVTSRVADDLDPIGQSVSRLVESVRSWYQRIIEIVMRHR